MIVCNRRFDFVMSICTKNAIIHCRISGSTHQKERESHEDQEEACRFVANRYEANVVEVWKETFSGRKNERPAFDEILAFIKKPDVKIDYYIVRAIDRFTRAGNIEYGTMKQKLAKVGVDLIDSYGIIQPPKNTLEHFGFEYDWSVQSPSEIAELVIAQTGKTEVTSMLTRMIGSEIRLTQSGFKVRQPNDGYMNKKVMVDGKKKTIQVPDPKREKYFRAMFDLRASGVYTDKEIVDKINAMGFRTKTFNQWDAKKEMIIGTSGGNQLEVKELQQFIQRPIYAGVMSEKWTNYQPVQAQYDGLVSIETFNKANRGKVFIKKDSDGTLQMLHDYSPYGKVKQRRLKDNSLFPFKFLLCPYCGKAFMGSSPQGKSGQRFPTYHCDRGHKYYGIPKKEFENNINKFAQYLQFAPKFMTLLEEVLIDAYRKREKEVSQGSIKMSQNVIELKTRKAAEIDAFVAAKDPDIKAEIEKRISALQDQIKNAEEKRNKIDITEDDIHQFVARAKYLMEHPGELVIDQSTEPNFEAQRALFGLVFEEMPTYHEILNGTPKLSLVFKLSSAYKGGKSELAGPLSLGWNTIEELVLKWKAVFNDFCILNSMVSPT